MPVLSFAQMEGKCYCCGKPGHKSTTCRAKDKPKPEWAINKAKLDNQSHLQAETATNDDQVSIHSNRDTQVALDRTIDWAGVHVVLPDIPIQFFIEDDLKTWILLDNESSVSIFCNHELVKEYTNRYRNIRIEDKCRDYPIYSKMHGTGIW